VITGTQTSGEDFLAQESYTTVLRYDVDANSVVSEGPVQASSESLTHGTLYDMDPALRFVFHVHSPEIWGRRQALSLPETRADVPYGTPDMAREVQRLFRETDVQARRIFAMAGHEDGVISFGRDPVDVGSVLREVLTRARALGIS
jgi:hypothetical protein